MSRFDWGLLLQAGVRGAGLRPAEFWALTPAELMLILGTDGAARPMARDALAALEAAFPDKTE
ncbi:MAG: phage tail assembly chaperone [Paracoccaceae bacterium]|nr:phage tail assembly chaperone [Paracoccaceae bacterium]